MPAATKELTLQEQFDAALAELKGKQRKFVLEYLHDLHGQNAAIRAGYSEATARSQASRMLTNVNIRAALSAGMALAAMPAPEVLYRIREQATATADDFLTIERVKRRDTQIVPTPTDDDPEAVRIVDGPEYEVVEVRIDLEKTQQRGKLHLLKEYRVDKDGAVTAKWYDSQAALFKLGEHHKLWVQRTELTGKDGDPIEINDARSRLADLLEKRAAAAAAESDPAADSGAG
jgi:phage terminase small subunit